MDETTCYWSRRELAQHFGVSHTYINNLTKEGRITSTADGIPVPLGIRQLQAILKEDKAHHAVSVEKRIQQAVEAERERMQDEIRQAKLDVLEEVFWGLDRALEAVEPTLAKCQTAEEVYEVLSDATYSVYEPLADKYDPFP